MLLSPQEIFIAFIQQKPLFYENETVLVKNNSGQTFTQQNFCTLQKIVSLLPYSFLSDKVLVII